MPFCMPILSNPNVGKITVLCRKEMMHMSEMTREEKVDSLRGWCTRHPCTPMDCRIYDICHQYPGDFTTLPDDAIDKIFEALWEGDDEVINCIKDEMKRQMVEEANLYTEHIVNPKCEVKLTGDQKAKADYGKEELTLVPRRIIHDICAIRMYGNKKYPEGGPDNWKQVAIERYRNATFRHFLAYLDDPQGKDEESGFPHLWHLACNIAFLCEMEDGNAQENNRDS